MLPYDILDEYLLPKLKCLIAIRLVKDYGISQLKVSKLLGVSQAMVNKYITKDPKKILEELSSIGLDPDEILYIVTSASEALNKEDVMRYERLFVAYINSLLSQGALCRLHRLSYPAISRECDVCRTLFKQQTDYQVADVLEAFDLFKSLAVSYMLVPEVGTNIVSCGKDARSITGIVGFSGRIIKVGKGVSVFGEPVYGGSRHLASILLAAYSRWREVRGAIAISFIEECIQLYKDMGFTVLEVGPHESKERIVSDIENYLRSLPEVSSPPDIIADLGGMGIEPIIYVLGRTAVDAVRKASLCAKLLESSKQIMKGGS